MGKKCKPLGNPIRIMEHRTRCVWIMKSHRKVINKSTFIGIVNDILSETRTNCFIGNTSTPVCEKYDID